MLLKHSIVPKYPMFSDVLKCSNAWGFLSTTTLPTNRELSMTIKPKPINFLDPEYYDISEVSGATPDIDLLTDLFDRMNAQSERLWEFFTEMIESPDYKPMTARSIIPRTLRKKKAKKKPPTEKPRAIDDPDSEEFMTGYKEFMKDEFDG